MESDEFSTSPVPADRSIPWWKIALSNVLFSVSLPGLIEGLDLAHAAPRRELLAGIAVGSVILTVIGVLTSMVGSRTRLSSYMLARLDNTLTLSGALFDIRWNTIQTDIILPTCTFDIKDNIGSAESKGVEFEVSDRLAEHLRVTLGANYTSAKIVDPVTILGVQKGDHVPGVPDYSISTSGEYTHPVGADAQGRLAFNGQWIGRSQGTIYHGDPDFDRPSYFVMGANAGVKWERLDLSLFITNLLNDNKAIERPNIAGVEYGIAVRPRTFGIGGSYTF